MMRFENDPGHREVPAQHDGVEGVGVLVRSDHRRPSVVGATQWPCREHHCQGVGTGVPVAYASVGEIAAVVRIAEHTGGRRANDEKPSMRAAVAADGAAIVVDVPAETRWVGVEASNSLASSCS